MWKYKYWNTSAGFETSGSLDAQADQNIIMYYDSQTEKVWFATDLGVSMLYPNGSRFYRWGAVLPDGVPISAETAKLMHLPQAPKIFKEEVQRTFKKSPIP